MKNIERIKNQLAKPQKPSTDQKLMMDLCDEVEKNRNALIEIIECLRGWGPGGCSPPVMQAQAYRMIRELKSEDGE